MKEEEIEKIKREITKNWKERNNFLGIIRKTLEDLSKEKNWKVRKVIAIMRRNKEINLSKRYYFIGDTNGQR